MVLLYLDEQSIFGKIISLDIFLLLLIIRSKVGNISIGGYPGEGWAMDDDPLSHIDGG